MDTSTRRHRNICSSRENLVTKTVDKATKEEACGITISHKPALSLAHYYLNSPSSKQL
jgi:hypothetical protein